ncbi:MAG: HD domain-containing protein [archaeon]
MENYKKWIPVLTKELNRFMKTAPSISPIHKNDHIKRVWVTSETLCKKLNGDQEIMVATVFLHDLGRHQGLEIHGEKSAELARPILEKVGFPSEKIPIVLDAIGKHDYTTPNEARTSIYAKILYDADKIDAFGKIGIQRHIQFYLRKGKTPAEILEMLEKRWAGLTLPESRKVGKAAYKIVKDYFLKLQKQQTRKAQKLTKRKIRMRQRLGR